MGIPAAVRGKKANIDLGLKEVAELVLVAITIVLAWAVIANVFSIFGVSDDIELESTINNFNRLASTISVMLEDDSAFLHKSAPFYIAEGYIIVGFDKQWTRGDGSPHMLDLSDDGPLLKPSDCADMACLCLYEDEIEEDDPTKKDENVIACKTFDKPVLFLAKYQEKPSRINRRKAYPPQFCGTKMASPFTDKRKIGNATIDDADYGRFIIYGKEKGSACGEWEAKTLYLEKLDILSLDPGGDGPTVIYAEIRNETSALRQAVIDKMDKQYGHAAITGLTTVSGIPLITCSEQGSSFGRICQANPGLRAGLERLSQETLGPKGYTAYITQAYRTWAIQNALLQCWIDEKGPNNDPRTCYAACDPGPNDGGIRCPHMTGGAVDIVISDANGKTIPPSESESIMCALDFVKYAGQGETWHFEFGTNKWRIAMEKKANNQPYCTYG